MGKIEYSRIPLFSHLRNCSCSTLRCLFITEKKRGEKKTYSFVNISKHDVVLIGRKNWDCWGYFLYMESSRSTWIRVFFFFCFPVRLIFSSVIGLSFLFISGNQSRST